MIKYIYKKMIMSEGKNNRQKADTIIKNHMIWSMGAGLIPVPIADFFAVSAIQLDMVRQIAKLYDLDFTETAGKASITALTGSGLARMGARAVKFIPGVGTVLGGITMSILSGASTYATGQVFIKHFETGGTFLDFDPARLKKYYNEQFEKGKKMAKDLKEDVKEEKQMKGESTVEITKKKRAQKNKESEKVKIEIMEELETDEVNDNAYSIAQLREIAKMKQEGIISEEEFEKMKKKIIKSM
jgi:uncharacterized protein (DUF697 family)